MGGLQQWMSISALVDVIIVITLLEAAALWGYHQQTKRGLRPRDYLLNIASGLCLMLALRSSLAGAVWYVVAAWLAGAGLAHLADIRLRLARPTQSH